MTEIDTLKVKTRRFITERNTTKVIEMRNELYSLMLECETYLENRLN